MAYVPISKQKLIAHVPVARAAEKKAEAPKNLNRQYAPQAQPEINPLPAAKPEQQMRVKYEERDLAALKKRWGDGPEENPYTIKQYEMLQDTYDSFASEYKGGLPARTKTAITRMAEAALKYTLAVDRNDSTDAKKWQEIIDKIMAGEALKVGDAKPVEKFSISGLAQGLEEKGMMDEGVLVLDGVIDYVKNDHGVFHVSKDAMDASLLGIYNAMMYNNGLPESDELPESIRVQNMFGEFLEAPTLDEQNAAMEFGISFPSKK
jgi:hypothetical protein